MADDLPDLTALAQDDAEAAKRYAAFRTTDPFPDVEPALLNTADLFNYIAATGMIHPFGTASNEIDHFLKPASCSIPVRGRFLFWDPEESGEGEAPPESTDYLGDDEFLTLKPNSIVYVTLKPMFRLPEYMAGRFNLTITEIYRGLLVGTGPLVDPGFVGRLSVPLHNLTANDYRLRGGESLVWMEFTKLSRHPRFANTDRTDQEGRPGRYVEFPQRKRRRDVRWYVNRASDGRPIVSSIPASFARTARAASAAQEAATGAQQQAEEIRNRFYRISGWGAVALFLGIAAVLASVWALLWTVRGDVADSRDSRDRVSVLERRVTEQSELIRSQRRTTVRLQAELRELRQAIARRASR